MRQNSGNAKRASCQTQDSKDFDGSQNNRNSWNVLFGLNNDLVNAVRPICK